MAVKGVRCKVASIRFFARTVDMIVEPEGLYLDLDVGKAGPRPVFDQAEGKTTLTLDGAGLAHICAAYTDQIEVAVRKQQEASLRRG